MKFGADYNHKYQLAAVLYVLPVLVSTLSLSPSTRSTKYSANAA